ncbi:multicopper oxidase family protein [Actinocrispum wychmicini]|uniref:multicopper oxidase family protein n=1 Tax=Actinocrispum wychmicini TaxID=1213861 RepID=UPI001A9E8295|nr:multicopper oxidase family protein [Actinocrispum wychmicini]
MKLVGAGGAVLALTECGVGNARPAAVPALPPFSVPLRIPPVARPDRQDATTDYYRVRMAETQAEVYPGLQTKVLTYNGQFPAATIVAKRGRRAVVTQYNGTSRPTAVHLHGAHLPRKDDGHPMDLVEAGQERVYEYPNTQPGATLWYHDHAHHTEAEQVYRGLAGLYVLDDEAEHDLGLPDGEYDVPLMLRDAQFDPAGQLVFVLAGFAGRQTLLVNGRPQPYFEVAARKYRFRLLNCSNDRTFRLRLSDNRPFQLIGSDSGLLPAPVTVTDFDLSPGERVEAVVDFAPYEIGAQVTLTNDLAEVESAKSVMRFDIARTAADHSRVPPTLRPLPDLGEATVERHILMRVNLGATISSLLDDKVYDPNRIDQRVKLGTTEIWTITNTDVQAGIPHNMHLHLEQFQVLDRDGKPVTGHETGLKDTVLVPAGGNVRIKVRFTDHPGLFVYHCHMLDHSALGMMGQMEIT